MEEGCKKYNWQRAEKFTFPRAANKYFFPLLNVQRNHNRKILIVHIGCFLHTYNLRRFHTKLVWNWKRVKPCVGRRHKWNDEMIGISKKEKKINCKSGVMDGESKTFHTHYIIKTWIQSEGMEWQRERGTKLKETGREENHSSQSFLMARHHSQERWSCLSSSVNLDLMA